MTGILIKCSLGAVITALLGLMLKEMRSEWGTLLAVTGGALLSLTALTVLDGLWESLTALAERTGLAREQLTLLLKGMGICFTAEFSAEVCRTCGHASLASPVLLAGKLCLCGLCVPLAVTLLELVESVLTL